MLSFRDASPGDAKLISFINATSWRETYRELLPGDFLRRLSNDYWVPSVRTWLASGRLCGRIAMEDGRPVGCCIFGHARDTERAGWGEIVSLYVLPDCMRRGVGGALLQDALRLLHEDGYSSCFLWTIEGNRIADAFYRKQGFVPTGDRFAYRIGGKDVSDVRYIHQ